MDPPWGLKVAVAMGVRAVMEPFPLLGCPHSSGHQSLKTFHWASGMFLGCRLVEC